MYADGQFEKLACLQRKISKKGGGALQRRQGPATKTVRSPDLIAFTIPAVGHHLRVEDVPRGFIELCLMVGGSRHGQVLVLDSCNSDVHQQWSSRPHDAYEFVSTCNILIVRFDAR